MTDDAAFLAAIIADPEDDSPRLIYADYLDENGECDRAEFIRVQVEVARMKPCRAAKKKLPPDENCVYCALRQRDQELRGCDSFPSWAPRVIVANVVTSVYTRGFIEVVQSAWLQWGQHGNTITAAAPIRGVTLATWPSDEWVVRTCEDIPNRQRGQLYGPLEALRFRWPTVKTWNLPPAGFVGPEPDLEFVEGTNIQIVSNMVIADGPIDLLRMTRRREVRERARRAGITLPTSRNMLD